VADHKANLASIRRAFELFNAGDFDTVFADVFHPEIDYRGDPDISALAGFPTDAQGTDGVRAVWEGFFSMFDRIELNDIQLEASGDDEVLGSCHMVTQGGSSEVPIDAPFYFAWVLRDGQMRFMSAKLDRDAVLDALRTWRDDAG
jgi:ketosteroid isomerase-like protein